MINGITVAGLSEYANEIKDSPCEGRISYGVDLNWETGTRSSVKTTPMIIGEHKVNRNFSWVIDEPRQLLGLNHGPNPQEYLLGGVGGCILVGYSVGASVMGIQLESLKVMMSGHLDLRGFFGIGNTTAPNFNRISYKVEIKGDGTKEQFETLHEKVKLHSPNRMTIANEVSIDGEMMIL